MAGFKSMGDLERALRARGVRGLGKTILYKTEREERLPDVSELREIAEACRLPFEWFSADLSRLVEISASDPRAEIARRIRAAAERSEVPLEGMPGGLPPQAGEDHGS